MSDHAENSNTKNMHDVLMHYKYCQAVKHLTKGITHEYNNIFTGLSGQTNILLQEGSNQDVSPKRKELIQNLLQRGIEQTDLLFDFSREMERTKRPISPLRIGNKAIDLLNAISRLHYFEMEANTDLPKILSNHRDLLLMLFYLGENAIEAMAEGGCITLEISVKKEQDIGDYVTFSMKDSGHGFSEKVKNTAFEPFTTTKTDAGTGGLGLYAVESIVSDHKGVVTHRQRDPQGTVVTIELPAFPTAEKKEGQYDRAEINSEQNGQHSQEKHVFLIVDDEEAMRDMLLTRLQRRGHIAFCVGSCAEAMEEFGYLADTISAVILDIGLRDRNGYDCADQLRTINKKIKVIFMSGQDDDGNGSVGNNAAFLRKPFRIEQLEQMVGDV